MKGEMMGWLNGKTQPGAGAVTPAPEQAVGNGHGHQQNGDYRHSNEAHVISPANGRGFRKAVKAGSKGRVALVGVSGSGKSFTMLKLARALAGPQGKIAAIDTEHGSLSKYAGEVTEFDVDEPESYTTEYLLDQLTWAEQNGYAVFCVDSLSHFWMGKDGALEFVDSAKRRTKDQMEGWKMFRPHEREMVDRFIASPCHIIVTMRCKTDYEERVVDGRKKRVKVGLAPVQREGLEYEFDLVCSMDDENNLVIDKTRCSAYSTERMRSVEKPTAEYFRPFIQWLDGPIIARPARPPRAADTATPIDTGGHPAGTRAAAAYVAEAKIASGDVSTSRPWTTFGEMKRVFGNLREIVGETAFLAELARYGWKTVGDIRSLSQAIECYHHLQFLAERAEEERKGGN